MQPLAISHFSIVNSLGTGAAAVARALREGRTGLTPCDFETVELETWDRAGGRIGRGPSCVPISAPTIAATTASRRRASSRMDTPVPSPPRAKNTGLRGSAFSWAPARRASCRPNSLIDGATQRRARHLADFRTPKLTILFLLPISCNAISVTRPDAYVVVFGMFVVCQSFRPCGAHDGSRNVRRRGGRRRRFAVPDHALWISLAGPDFARAVPHVRCGPRRHLGRRRRRVSRCSKNFPCRTRPAACGYLSARAATPYHMSTPHAEGLGAASGHATGARQRPASRPPTIDCVQSARDRHQGQRRKRRPAGVRVVPAANGPVSSSKGRDRAPPRVPPALPRRSLSAATDRTRIAARRPAYAERRTGTAQQLSSR